MELDDKQFISFKGSAKILESRELKSSNELADQIQIILNSADRILLNMNEYTSAICNIEDKYYFFDSHANNIETGQKTNHESEPGSKSIMIQFSSIDYLKRYISDRYESEFRQRIRSVDIYTVKFLHSAKDSKKKCVSFDGISSQLMVNINFVCIFCFKLFI